MTTNIRFVNKGKTGEIWLYGDIGEGFFGGISSAQFKSELVSLGRVDLINLRINSLGGDVFEGITIMNSLRAHPARKEIDIDGIAASIASVIAMSGDEIRIADNGSMMIHNPNMLSIGDAQHMRAAAERLDRVKDQIITSYQRTGLSREKLSDYMDLATEMNGSEAVALGFADKVNNFEAIAAFYDASKPYGFKRVPSHVSGTRSAGHAMAQVKLIAMETRSRVLTR